MLMNLFIIIVPTLVILYDYNVKKTTNVKHVDLETIYCKNPQTFSKSAPSMCSSTAKFFMFLSADCGKQRKNVIVKSDPGDTIEVAESVHETVETVSESVGEAVNETVIVVNSTEEEALPVDRKEDSTVVDLFVVGLLVVSAIYSIVELYKERKRRQLLQASSVAGTPGDLKSGDRRMSLVDLTVSRHARRRESQQIEVAKGSTNTGIKQPPPLIRRMSFPAQIPEVLPVRGRHPAPMRQQSWTGSNLTNRKMSLDLSEDDSSPDRRRIRMIRRH
uniref:Uncharacterized protein n=1 Tax=Clastoptera arizonana TaxID=38151 RepID=A0A1B6CL75_9HEMI